MNKFLLSTALLLTGTAYTAGPPAAEVRTFDAAQLPDELTARAAAPDYEGPALCSHHRSAKPANRARNGIPGHYRAAAWQKDRQLRTAPVVTRCRGDPMCPRDRCCGIGNAAADRARIS
jgi:hypothetical protein